MGMAISLRDYLSSMDTSYEIITHPHAERSSIIAAEAHIPDNKLAKGVLLATGSGYLMVVVPADHKVDLHKIERTINEKTEMAKEEEVEMIFNDCDPGAVPPIGQAYGLMVLVDNDLCDEEDVFLESGDHESLLHLAASDFRSIMQGAIYGDFSKSMYE
ncbi:aminoacyl-tRNA deacylase [Luteithermobacter gelatinilyticus]|uniref:aminoacyl-tRNA deacylase n=1 Tax=Luteithermobacter gelatinilyticus TaxID=2582913 RepID=UPI0011063720|nr:YbaK/EbsC family protein [Luteithermobacter gelatinilyticus]|tara:strand:+ start:4930 stop:5406 length:477 start_codon:yes stop_codon:yes gene_type:complete